MTNVLNKIVGSEWLSDFFFLWKIRTPSVIVPWIFGSQDIFLSILSPTIAVIRRSFKPIVRADFHLFCPCRQCLSARLIIKHQFYFMVQKMIVYLIGTKEIHLFLEAFMFCSFWSLKFLFSSSLRGLPSTEIEDSKAPQAELGGVDCWDCPVEEPLHLRINRAFS